MKAFSYQIKDQLGIHARPAGMLVKLLQGYQSSVMITRDGKHVDGKKLFALMSMGVKMGDTVQLAFDGPDEEEAAQAAEKFFTEQL